MGVVPSLFPPIFLVSCFNSDDFSWTPKKCLVSHSILVQYNLEFLAEQNPKEKQKSSHGPSNAALGP